MATGIIAGLSAVAATIATPTGLTAFGVWLGLVDEPLIVTVAPMLDKLATVCGTISGMTYFYAVRKKRQTAKQSAPDHSAPSD
ncbi:hypothetical protein A1342_04580 [Methylomonas methanica]|uniref:Uncharacterized protein n=2 Tax=Methylomonas TaxID=416 RepID=A0A140E473_9GAMM|nr:hypothetical protein JT25_001635 [Methylomonas denitrificans]OAH99468.1 hypothetical protein A1342_04580 [Methylomonas methanica]